MAIAHIKVSVGFKFIPIGITSLYVDNNFDARGMMFSYIPYREPYAKPIRRW